jgi:tetratricopeptide (TPR) repeat protein
LKAIPAGIAAIAAADRTEQSLEDDKLGNGVFTHSLIDALSGLADTDNNGIVTYKEVKDYLYEKVPEATGKQQHPQFSDTTTETGDIPMSLVKSVSATTDATAEMALLTIRIPDLDGVEATVEGQSIGMLSQGVQRAIRLPAGQRTITLTKGPIRHTERIPVEPGKRNEIEINLAFSTGDETAFLEPPSGQVDIYLKEDVEPSKEAKELWLKGAEAFNKQKFDDAINLFTRAAQANGGAYADAFVYCGRAQQSLGKHADAVESYRKALTLKPSDYQTQTLLAEARFMAGMNIREVEAQLRDIMLRHPKYYHAPLVLADVLMNKENKDFSGAERAARLAVRNNPKAPPAHMILSDVLTRRNDPAKLKEAITEAQLALQQFEEFSKKKVSALKALKFLSVSHIVLGGGQYANDAAMAEAHYILGQALTRAVGYGATDGSGDAAMLAEARTHIQRTLDLARGPSNTGRLILALDLSSQNFIVQGDIANAIKEGEAALKLSASAPNPLVIASVHYTLSQAYESNQKFVKAAEHRQKYAEVFMPGMSPDERRGLQEEIKQLKREAEASGQNP